MTNEDVPEALQFWASFQGVALNEGDTVEGVATFLARNPGLSFVAIEEDRIVGAVMCGHDGRRGFMYHLAVSEHCRGRGLGRALVEAAVGALRDAGIPKFHVMVFRDNAIGNAFWTRLKSRLRTDIALHTLVLDGDK